MFCCWVCRCVFWVVVFLGSKERGFIGGFGFEREKKKKPTPFSFLVMGFVDSLMACKAGFDGWQGS